LVGVAEAFVDGLTGDMAMTFATGLNYDAFQEAKAYTPRHLGAVMVGNIVTGAAWAVAWNMVSDARRALRYNSSRADTGAEAKAQAALVRDIFGNPFRPSPTLPPAILAWNDRTILRLAQAIYDERQMPEGTFDTSRLAVLGDALLDAGCDDEELIRHCRSEGPHVRGCWAVDLILGKS
jgi:hypothetical protein